METQTKTDEAQSFQPLIEALGKKKGHIQEGMFSWASSTIARYPWRSVESTPYEVVVGEMLLEKTTYAVANRVIWEV